MKNQLSPELTQLVDWTVIELGHIIERELGKSRFCYIEKIRRRVKSKGRFYVKDLFKLKEQLQILPAKERFEVAHAFAMMLELINTCEAAYRVHRLRITQTSELISSERSNGQVIHVLTAHPTESRNPSTIFYFKKIQDLLVAHLTKPNEHQKAQLRFYLSLAWKRPMSRQKKPTVMDEAEYIYTLALTDEFMDFYIKNNKFFSLRTWVGGDKDGHPGVNENTMIRSLELSRNYLISWLKTCLEELKHQTSPLLNANSNNIGIDKLQAAISVTKKELVILKKIKTNDYLKIKNLENTIAKIDDDLVKLVGTSSVVVEKMLVTFKIFPGLVVPLELREEAKVIHQALVGLDKDFSISRMLNTLSKLNSTGNIKNYVRGFIISGTESPSDIQAGVKLVKMKLGSESLPVIPLFESAYGLQNCVHILDQFLRNKKIQSTVIRNWNKKIEVMLGYSDSAKENGVFPSRFLIQSAISNIEKIITKYKFKPIFFHGSGGSIERGGGSIQEQTEWWPPSALANTKLTIQGEMVYRNYAAPEILNRQVRLVIQANKQRQNQTVISITEYQTAHLKKMSDFIQKAYQTKISDTDFLHVIEHATPYLFLKDLRFGSRPSRRQGSIQIKNLRAIPWVLCWTQNRALFPAWWGAGSFWFSLTKKERFIYRQKLRHSSLFTSYVKALGFTLAKIDLEIFSFHLYNSGLQPHIIEKFDKEFRLEFHLSKQFVREITKESSLLWYRPWLETEIKLRSPLIHPLNVLQIIAVENNDSQLFRETITGIASGMLTTG